MTEPITDAMNMNTNIDNNLDANIDNNLYTSDPIVYEAFIYKKLTEGTINDSQINYLLSAQGNDEMMATLESMNLRQEYKNYCNQRVRNHQDNQYQASLIEDMMKKNNRYIEKYQANVASLKQKVGPLIEEYNNWEVRVQKFPENPHFREKRNSLHEGISSINTEIDLLEQEIIHMEEFNNTLQIAKSVNNML